MKNQTKSGAACAKFASLAGVRAGTARVAVQMPYGRLPEVVRLADDLVEIVAAAPFRGRGRRAFEEWSGIETRMSYNRLLAAVRIAERVAQA